jgi:peptidoglycan/xylan/chitin deacetylase (PgdA/CDA1 family)
LRIALKHNAEISLPIAALSSKSFRHGVCAPRAVARVRLLSLSHDFAPQFALPRAEQSRPARVVGKLSRFAARTIAVKTVRLTNEKPLVSFTFDDAPVSACTIGAALLEEYKARGTYYVCGAGCGIEGFCGRLAAAADLTALAAKGHEIGCHTFSHVAVARVGRQRLSAELARNGAFLRGVQRAATFYNFAYPYGEFSLTTKLYLQRQFDSCRSLLPGVNIGSADLGALKSCELQNASIDRRGVAAIIAEAVRRNGWLIFTCHDVAAEPSRFGVSPDLLSFALATAHDAGCHLTSVRDALLILRGSVAYPGSEDLG